MLREELQYTKYRLALFAVSAAILLSHDYWPDKVTNLVPGKAAAKVISVDEETGGSSKHNWIDKASNSWQCNVGDQAPYPYCAVIYTWANESPIPELDLDRYSSLKMSLEYKGNASQLKVFFKNARHSSDNLSMIEIIGKGEYHEAHVSIPESTQIITIPLEDFKIADWWLTQHDLQSTTFESNLSKVVALGIDIPHPIPLGIHQFKIKKIYATGTFISKDDLYLSIISFWALLILHEIVISYRNLKLQVKSSKEKVKALSVENAQIRKIAEMDSLTSLRNRTGLSNAIEQLGSKNQLDDYSVLVIDIDHFKHFNDQYGHTVGDLILQKIAEIIQNSLRKSDYAARWGGEEFVILLGSSATADINFFAERLRQNIANHAFQAIPNANDRSIKVSIGAAHLNNFNGFDDTFDHADKALYRAKHSGRNRSIVFTSKEVAEA